MSFMQRYGIVIIAVVLSMAAFLATKFVPVELALVFVKPVVAPCSKLQAWRGVLARNRREAMDRDIAAQCVALSADSAGFKDMSTPQGNYWIPKDTEAALKVLVAQQATGIYSSNETPVKPGDIVLDGGAHVGVFTRVALRAGAKLVVAIEPAPENIECLRRNFKAEIAAGRVIVYPKGVWNEDAVLPMHLNRNSAGDSFVVDLDSGHGVVNLPLTTIDKLTTELQLPRVDYVKLDVKGAEVQALHGAKGVLSKYRPRLAVASEHLDDDPINIPRAVMAANPNYRVACGVCYRENDQLRPEVLHFY